MDTCGNTRMNELCLVQTRQIMLSDISNQKTLQDYVASCSPISICFMCVRSHDGRLFNVAAQALGPHSECKMSTLGGFFKSLNSARLL